MTVPGALLPLIAMGIVFGTMGVEALRSASNERALHDRGARLVPDPSYTWMQVVYPAGFLMTCLEGWWRGVHWDTWVAAGLAIFVLGKGIKYAAIATLGPRWTFRVLVLPGAPLVSRGIYRVLRHPNYLGVAGEVLGIALWMRAPIAGTLFGVMFGFILLWRIHIEERALGLAADA